MKFLKDNWLIIAVIILFGGNLTQFLNPIVKVQEVIKRDTVTTVTVDSVSLTRAKAELEYLRSQIVIANGKIKYVTKKVIICDTITVDNTEFIVPNFIASLDTTYKQSSIKLKYHYPQNVFTDISFTYPQNSQVITNTVEVSRLFSFQHGIQAGFGYGVINRNLDFYIGYGFTLGLNL